MAAPRLEPPLSSLVRVGLGLIIRRLRTRSRLV